MTSHRSDYEFSYWSLLFCTGILALWIVLGASAFDVLLGAVLMGFALFRDHRRRSTLHRREDGVYVWIEWHGGERSSASDPTDDWDSEGDGDGGD